MLRKPLAVLLVGSWLVLSAIDMLEDLDLVTYLKIHVAESPEFPDFGCVATFANNAVENGTRRIAAGGASLIGLPAEANFGFQPHDEEATGSKKTLKIYKLGHAFLI